MTLVALFHMITFIVGLVSLPYRPNDGQPAIGQATNSVRAADATLGELVVIGNGPSRFAQGEKGELGNQPAELFVARSAKADGFALAALLGHGTGASQGLHRGRGREALPIITKLDQQAGGEQLASLGE